MANLTFFWLMGTGSLGGDAIYSIPDDGNGYKLPFLLEITRTSLSPYYGIINIISTGETVDMTDENALNLIDRLERKTISLYNEMKAEKSTPE